MEIFGCKKLSMIELAKVQNVRLPVSFYVINLGDWLSGIFDANEDVFYDPCVDEYYSPNEISKIVILPD